MQKIRGVEGEKRGDSDRKVKIVDCHFERM
jgi:hypothetical protein